MTDKNKKSLILSTLLLIFGIIVIALYSISPKKELEAETFLINFDSDGGSAIAAITIEEGSAITKPTAPTKEGYIFVGWMLGDEYYDFDKEITGDVTLRAIWKEVEPDKIYYTVSFDTDGGTAIANQVVEEGLTASRPSSYPTKEGYTFTGWELNGETYDFNSPIKEDITITAGWEKEEEPVEPTDPEEPEEPTYTVRFNANGGSLGRNCGNQTVKSGERATAGCTASRSGYTFIGFNTNRNATSAQNISSRRITSNTTYYAIWRQNQTQEPEPPKITTYSISFKPNGGTLGNNCPGAGSSRTVNEGTSLNSVCTVTRPHYQFAGWTYNNRSTSTAIGRGDYTATWRLNTFTVGCEPIYNAQNIARSCKPYAKEGNTINNNIKIYIGGSAARPTMGIKGGWDEVTAADLEIEIDGIRTSARKEG